MAVGGAARARRARTSSSSARSPSTSLLRLRLETGRTHQIRVHLQAIGHPVAGDPEYGGRGALGLQRQFLHAARLAFAHPFTGERIDVGSPLPADLQAALPRRTAILSAQTEPLPAPDLGRGPARCSDQSRHRVRVRPRGHQTNQIKGVARGST